MFALAQGFYMQTCRKLKPGSRSTGHGPIYLTIAEAEGSLVRIDKQSHLQEEEHDYIVYTQLSGVANR